VSEKRVDGRRVRADLPPDGVADPDDDVLADVDVAADERSLSDLVPAHDHDVSMKV